MTTIEERVSRLEGSYEHMATQVQLAELKGEFKLMAQQIEVLAQGVVGLNETVAGLSETIVGLSETIAGLRETVAGVIDRLDALETSGPAGRMGYRPGS